MKARLLFILAVPFLLAGCFLMPGNFGSTLDVRKEGSFSYAYKGEIVVQTGDRMFGGGSASLPEPDAERCWGPIPEAKVTAGGQDAAITDSAERACTAQEMADRKKERDERQAAAEKRRKDEGEKFAQMTGFNPTDDQAMKGFAAQIAKQKGWKSVTYKGKGVFNVDYAITGTLDRDFIFPVFPRGNVIFPFVVVRKRADGNVGVTAPTFVGGGMMAMAALYGVGGSGREMAGSTQPKGSFAVSTNGRFLTNNTEDGPVAGSSGQTATWAVGDNGDKMPEALITLD